MHHQRGLKVSEAELLQRSLVVAPRCLVDLTQTSAVVAMIQVAVATAATDRNHHLVLEVVVASMTIAIDAMSVTAGTVEMAATIVIAVIAVMHATRAIVAISVTGTMMIGRDTASVVVSKTTRVGVDPGIERTNARRINMMTEGR